MILPLSGQESEKFGGVPAQKLSDKQLAAEKKKTEEVDRLLKVLRHEAISSEQVVEDLSWSQFLDLNAFLLTDFVGKKLGEQTNIDCAVLSDFCKRGEMLTYFPILAGELDHPPAVKSYSYLALLRIIRKQNPDFQVYYAVTRKEFSLFLLNEKGLKPSNPEALIFSFL